MLGDRSVEDLRQLAALNENTTDLAAALRWAADRIDELEAATIDLIAAEPPRDRVPDGTVRVFDKARRLVLPDEEAQA